MTKQYTSLEHSIRNIMEGRSNKVEQPKTLEQSILEGGHTLDEKVGPRPPNANTAPAPPPPTAAQAAEFVASLTPFIGTGMSARDTYNAFQKGEYLKATGLGALTAVSGLSDLALVSVFGTPLGAAGKVAIAGVKTGSKVADAATAAGTAAKVTGAASDAAKAADAASDLALIRKITSGKKKGDTPPASNAGQEIIQGNTRLKPEVLTQTNADNRINVPKPANDAGAPSSNVVGLPRKVEVPNANPNTKIDIYTPGQPVNRNAPTFNSSAPNTTTVKPKAADNQTTAPSAAVTGTSTRVASNAVDNAAGARAADNAADARAADNAADVADAARLKNADNRRAVSNARARSRGRFGRGALGRVLGKLRLSPPNIKTAFDSQSAAGQASGVGTYMHKAGAPLKVTEENEADTARTSIENVARLNSRRGKAVKQQEIQKKILDEKKSLADTVKRNVEEIRTKRKTESPIITNPELKRPEPEGINNVR